MFSALLVSVQLLALVVASDARLPAAGADDPAEAPSARSASLPITLQLRDKATLDGHLVRLGQLVVLADDHPSAETLQQLVLGPGPSAGETQHWGRERISRILDRHGWGEQRYRWSGAKSCQLQYTRAAPQAGKRTQSPDATTIRPSSPPSPAVQTASAVAADRSAGSVQTANFQSFDPELRQSTGSGLAAAATSARGLAVSDLDQTLTPAELAIRKRRREMAERHVRQALLTHVEAQTGGTGRWKVDFQIPDDYVGPLSERRSLIDISGGGPPWAGNQRLRLLLDDQGLSRTLDLDCQLTARPWVVTAVGPLRRDRTLDASDLEMRPLEQEVEDVESFFFTDVQQALGLRLTQALTSGQPLRRSHTALPMLVERHAGVEVLVRAGLIEITTQGRCLEAGGLGDMIAVEILPQKHRLMARVIDSHRVEVVSGEATGVEPGRTAAGRGARSR